MSVDNEDELKGAAKPGQVRDEEDASPRWLGGIDSVFIKYCGRPLSTWRRRVCCALSIILFLAIIATGFLCAVPGYYFFWAGVTVIPLILGNLFYRALAVLLLLVAIHQGIQDLKEASCGSPRNYAPAVAQPAGELSPASGHTEQ